MFGNNDVWIEGRLGRDPELRTTKGGTSIATLSLAVEEKKTDGEKRTTWVDVKVFKGLAVAVANTFGKGADIAVSGRLSVEEWDDKDTGHKRRRTVVLASVIYQRLWPARAEQPPGDGNKEAAEVAY